MLNGDAKVYDLIIFFDDSNNLKNLLHALQMIYGFMNLSAKLVFHSARFPLGPYGWTNYYPFMKTSNPNEKNPWSHLNELEKPRRNGVPMTELYETSKVPPVAYFDGLSRSIDYNATIIPKMFLERGLTVTENILIQSIQWCPIKNFTINTDCGQVEIAPAISHQILLAEKASWLDGTYCFLN